eukprot:6640337-Heterocapsa_arctica.AAC.1
MPSTGYSAADARSLLPEDAASCVPSIASVDPAGFSSDGWGARAVLLADADRVDCSEEPSSVGSPLPSPRGLDAGAAETMTFARCHSSLATFLSSCRSCAESGSLFAAMMAQSAFSLWAGR